MKVNVQEKKSSGKRSKKLSIILHCVAIVFDLDNTLVKAHYKKHKLENFDACVYMNILNSKKVKVRSLKI